MLKSLRVSEAHECTASARVDKKLPVQMFDLVNLISSFVYTTAPKHGIKLLCPHTYNSVSTAEIYVVYNMVIHNYSVITYDRGDVSEIWSMYNGAT